MDHVIPLSQGGASTWGNTVAACARCNPAPTPLRFGDWCARDASSQRKADRTPHEAGTGNYTACVRLLVEPKAPRTNCLVASGDVPAAWKVWIEL